MSDTTTTTEAATTETAIAAQTAAATTETTAAPIAPSANVRPEFIPEKFWDKEKGEAKLDQLAISYSALETKLGQKKEITKPGADAKPEEIAAYQAQIRKITGAPEKVEDYGLKAPENLPEGVTWNGELAGKAAGIAHKYGVPAEALHELIALNNENMGGLVKASAEAEEAARVAMIDGLNAEWKDEAKVNWQRAARGATVMGVDINTSKLANDADFIKAALAVDKMIAEDKGLVSGESNATYAEQMKRISDGDDYNGKNGPAKQLEAQAALKRLFDASKV
jgi:hypothetical protein